MSVHSKSNQIRRYGLILKYEFLFSFIPLN